MEMNCLGILLLLAAPVSQANGAPLQNEQHNKADADKIALAKSLKTAGKTFLIQGKTREAAKAFRESLIIYEAQLGPESEEAGSSHMWLGSVLTIDGEYKEAHGHLIFATKLFAKMFGEENPSYIATSTTLATNYGGLGNYQEARKLYGIAERFYANKKLEDSMDYADCMISLGHLYFEWQQFDAAQQAVAKAQRVIKLRVGEDSFPNAICLGMFAEICLAKKKPQDAIKFYEASRQVRKTLFGEKSVNYRIGSRELGVYYLELGDADKAEPFVMEGWRALVEIGSEKNRPSLADSLAMLGRLYLAQKKYIEASAMLSSAIALFESSCGEEHPLLLNVHVRYAEVLRHLGQIGDAAAHEQKAKNIQKRIDSIKTPGT